MIPDPEDTKPEDWDAPQHIADSEASKPADWDDVRRRVGGAMIDNPVTRRVETQRIPNLESQGPWSTQNPNPEYSPSRCCTASKISPALQLRSVAGQVRNDFDNVIIADSVEEAEAFAKETFDVTSRGKKMKDELDAKRKGHGRKRRQT